MSDMFRRRRPTSTSIGGDKPSPPRRPEREEDRERSNIERMIDDARPSGRLPILAPDAKRRAWADRWKRLVRGTRAPEPKPRAPVFEESRYAPTDDQEYE